MRPCAKTQEGDVSIGIKDLYVSILQSLGYFSFLAKTSALLEWMMAPVDGGMRVKYDVERFVLDTQVDAVLLGEY